MDLSPKASPCDHEASGEGPSEHDKDSPDNDKNPPKEERHGITFRLEGAGDAHRKDADDHVNNRNEREQGGEAADDIVKDRQEIKILKVFIHTMNPLFPLNKSCPSSRAWTAARAVYYNPFPCMCYRRQQVMFFFYHSYPLQAITRHLSTPD
jgi:hypothetical protein